jgi:type III pantothenate kinase
VAVELWPEISISREKSQASGFGITNAYLEPEKLGVDRWLAMIAGYHTYHKAICIVSCGTAITLDIVDDEGIHQGGLISPGLRLMQESLAKNTENLELSETGYSFGLANFTAAAIHNGTLSAACGLIEHTLSNHNQPDSLQLLLTGGDAEIIAEHLSRPFIIDRELVLRGLALTLIETQ